MHEHIIAIIDPNTLAVMGLRQLLQAVVPGMEADAFGSFAELQGADHGQYVHYFVAQTVVVEHLPYFLDRLRQTLVLTTSRDPQAHLGRFKSLCVSQGEQHLARSILQMRQRGHGMASPVSAPTASPAPAPTSSPASASPASAPAPLPLDLWSPARQEGEGSGHYARSTENVQPLLSNREVEVLALLVRGLINKEVADRLSISLATVVTHRKNIVEKTGLRSLAALTIYAVMHGYVDISEI